MPDTPADIVALADALRPALLRVSRRLRLEAQKVGLSAQDAILLGQIQKNPGIGVSALADAERISRPTMSAQIKRLEADGLVTKTVQAEDGRRSGLTITLAGERKVQVVQRARNDWLAARLVGLPAADRAVLQAATAPLLRLLDL